MSFNYDVLLERALDAVGVPYRLFPDRYLSVNKYGAVVDDAREEVIVLKMHGSIDWFDRTQYDQVEGERLKAGLPPGHSDPVFGRIQERKVTPLTDGPRFLTDPLMNIYRVGDIEGLYRNDPLFFATPVLLNPSPAKLVYSTIFRGFWDGLGRLGVFNFGMTIIGFSMPPQDEYLRQVLYRLVRNYQDAHPDDGALGHTKTPLVLIDYRSSKQSRRELLDRYRFVDFDKTIVLWNGFDEEALATLQRNS